MSLGDCPTYGCVECAAGVCFVCGRQLDENRCPPPEDVVRIDFPLGWEGLLDHEPGDLARRPTTLITLTVRKPIRDAREVESNPGKALEALHARLCGCDSPGKLAYCSFDEFAALDPERAKA